MTPIIWPTLDNNGMPSWVRANRANEQAYVRKVPVSPYTGVAAASKGMPSLRRGRSYSIAILVLVAVIALRRKR